VNACVSKPVNACITAVGCFITFYKTHHNDVAHKDDTHDCVENEFSCHGPVIDFEFNLCIGKFSQNQFL
jgi:hypothetical protein